MTRRQVSVCINFEVEVEIKSRSVVQVCSVYNKDLGSNTSTDSPARERRPRVLGRDDQEVRRQSGWTRVQGHWW
jgi:hypothetical protein